MPWARPRRTGRAGTVRLPAADGERLQLISRRTAGELRLLATLMVQSALVEPELTVQQVGAMHVASSSSLLEKVNEISGITRRGHPRRCAEAPLAKAAFVLAASSAGRRRRSRADAGDRFLLHLQMLSERERR